MALLDDICRFLNLPRHAGEMASHHFLFMIQHVNAQFAVPLEYRVHRAVGIDAHHDRRWRIGHRAHGGRGDAAAAGVALGGYNVDRSRQAGHGIAKTQTLFI